MLYRKAQRKYLQSYSEFNQQTGATLADALKLQSPSASKHRFHQAVVIPAFDEGEAFLHRLLALPAQAPTLFVLVLNAPESAAKSQLDSTLQPLTHLRANYSCSVSGSGCHWFNIDKPDASQAVLVLNLAGRSNAHWLREGVGYARKVGTDCCLWLYHNGLLASPWIRQTDADVTWPDDYLEPISAETLLAKPDTEQPGALLYPFKHDLTQVGQNDASVLYDAWLRYYVAGLRWADSPWAFHTVGSTLVVHAEHYAVHRGFPVLDAGEDFYLLNKMAKSGSIITLARSPLVLSSRCSTRTPFGTGRAIYNMSTTAQQQRFYHPDIFKHLKFWQHILPSLFTRSDLILPDEHKPLQEALLALGIPGLIRHSHQHGKNQVTFHRHLQNGFDAAMTRKCVHWLRRHYYPDISLQALLQSVNRQSVPFIPASSCNIGNAAELSVYLQMLETSHYAAAPFRNNHLPLPLPDSSIKGS